MIETFPVGGALAFDAWTGRLRAVCPRCRRWNLAPLEERPALEMALHEEGERRALEGELAALEEAWREAEEIAAIADVLPVDPLHRRAIR